MGTSSSIVGKLYMNYNDYNLYLKEVSTFEIPIRFEKNPGIFRKTEKPTYRVSH